MQKLFGFSFSILFLFLFVSNISAQQWTEAQKEVWAGVNAYWEAGMSDDPSGILSYFDESYFGWNYESDAPAPQSHVVKSMTYWYTKGKTKLYTLTPARIWVNGDFAYVHYYYYMVNESNEGKPMAERGRWTDILMKKDGKWMLVGDHGGKIDYD
jgi:ketosteroid isomerase-like protein